MMNNWSKFGLGLVGCALLAGGGVWAWNQVFVKKWVGEAFVSKAASEDAMLAARTLLIQRGHSVKTVSALAEMNLRAMPDGMLLLPSNDGIVMPDQAEHLLAWVKRGNTLVVMPKWSADSHNHEHEDEDEDADADSPAPAKPAPAAAPAPEVEEEPETETEVEAEDGPAAASKAEAKARAEAKAKAAAEAAPAPAQDEEEPEQDESEPADVEIDPIGARLGVELGTHDALPPVLPECAYPDLRPAAYKTDLRWLLTCVTPPGQAYPLLLEAPRARLASGPNAPKPAWRDAHGGEALQVHAEGKGRIVLVAHNYFDNQALGRFDHAQLLLALGALTPDAKQVQIVHHLDVVKWYRALWQRFSLALVSVALGLALLLWSALRRFGPLLPEPSLERRSLLEHIDASGRWLWKAPGGPEILLAAARALTLNVFRRRAPELLRMDAAEQEKHLVRFCKIGRDELHAALHQPAAGRPLEFTRQIKTLQILRTHYER